MKPPNLDKPALYWVYVYSWVEVQGSGDDLYRHCACCQILFLYYENKIILNYSWEDLLYTEYSYIVDSSVQVNKVVDTIALIVRALSPLSTTKVISWR